jgi:hypothetical protein
MPHPEATTAGTPLTPTPPAPQASTEEQISLSLAPSAAAAAATPQLAGDDSRWQAAEQSLAEALVVLRCMPNASLDTVAQGTARFATTVNQLAARDATDVHAQYLLSCMEVSEPSFLRDPEKVGECCMAPFGCVILLQGTMLGHVIHSFLYTFNVYIYSLPGRLCCCLAYLDSHTEHQQAFGGMRFEPDR